MLLGNSSYSKMGVQGRRGAKPGMLHKIPKNCNFNSPELLN